MKRTFLIFLTLLFAAVLLDAATALAGDPLPAWNGGKAKETILAFVKRVTTPGSPEYVPSA